jgi:tetratricopeptide (TPR) repeat protein
LIFTSLPVFGEETNQNLREQKRDFNRAVRSYNKGNFPRAASILTAVLDNPESAVTSSALLVLMKTQTRLAKYDEALLTGQELMQRFPDSRYLSDTYASIADVYISNGNYSAAYGMYLRARNTAHSSISVERLDRRILTSMQLPMSSEIPDEFLLTDRDLTREVLSINYLAMAYADIVSGNKIKAMKSLDLIDRFKLPKVYLGLYRQLKNTVKIPKTKSITLGFVLPLTGEASGRGTAFVSGLEYALKKDSKRLKNISFLIIDNHSQELETLRAVQRFKSNPEIFAVVGPLESKNVFVAVGAMSDSEKPLIIPSYSTVGITGLSENIFQFNSTEDYRGRMAARVAQSLDLNNIAVLAPINDNGYGLVDAFLKECDRLNISIAAVEWYRGIPEDVSRQLKNIRDKAWELEIESNIYDEFLGMEIDSIEALFNISDEDFTDVGKNHDKTMSRADSLKIELETIQGLYVPVDKNHISYIGAQIPAFNVKTTIIGNEGWLDPNVMNQANIGPHFQGLLVLGNPILLQKDQFDWDNPEIMDLESFVQAYDMVGFFEKTIAGKKVNQYTLTTKLMNTETIHGVASSFLISGTEERINTALRVAEYRNNKFYHVGTFIQDSLIFQSNFETGLRIDNVE